MGFAKNFLKRAAQVGAVSTITPIAVGGVGYGSFALNTRDIKFVPFDSYPESASLKKLNPENNPPACIDHAVRRVPLSQLYTTDQEELTKRFCRGIWGGRGFEIQKFWLERDAKAKERHSDNLWDQKDLQFNDYKVGTKIADHFEVVERTADKVVVRCGDTPTNQGSRPSDGIFEMQVTRDGDDALFHLKSVFFNSTSEGKQKAQLPWWFDFGHKAYTKYWMDHSVRGLTVKWPSRGPLPTGIEVDPESLKNWIG